MIGSMALTISEIAKQIGLRPSAIRYYEQIGILPIAREIARTGVSAPAAGALRLRHRPALCGRCTRCRQEATGGARRQ